MTNGRDLVDAAKRQKPDLVIVDISMPLLNGLDAGQEIKLALPDVKMIFLTVNDDPDLVLEAFQRGASVYWLKHCAVSELTNAIEHRGHWQSDSENLSELTVLPASRRCQNRD